MSTQVKNWYILSNGKKVGPVSEQNIISYYEQKRITGDTKVAKSGMKAWVSLSASGILDSEFDEDDLPPLPQEEQKKKPKAASIILGVAMMIIGMVGIIFAIRIF